MYMYIMYMYIASIASVLYLYGSILYVSTCIYLRQMRKYFKEDIVRDLLTSATAQAELEAEWQQLKEDRENLRSTFPTGNSRVRSVCDRARSRESERNEVGFFFTRRLFSQ